MRGLLSLLGLVAFILAVVWILLRWLTRMAKIEYAASARELKTLAALSIEEARLRGQELLDRGDVFRCVEAPVDPSTLPERLGSQLRGLLSRYQSIETATGPSTCIDRSRLALSLVRDGLLPIGVGMEGTDVEYEVAARADTDEIVELHPGEGPDPTFGTYPTIYHWVLAVAKEVAEARGVKT